MKKTQSGLSDSLLSLLLVSLFIVCFVVPEVLIFAFEAEAREDWMRMLPVALFAPFFWTMSVCALVGGFWFIWQSIRERELYMLPFSLALIYPGIRVPFYWIKQIVIEDVPAFGYNPDNIYAVTGLNTMGLGILWAIEGGIVALLLVLISRGVQLLVKGTPNKPDAGDGK